ncbi:MAG: DUF1804 family protein [Magnetococcales bacterium]|nr:DUF1804 family protein [Magnetococcales bacterium]
MAHDPKTRQRLRAAFVSGMTLEEAAAQARVALSTAIRWRDASQGSW